MKACSSTQHEYAVQEVEWTPDSTLLAVISINASGKTLLDVFQHSHFQIAVIEMDFLRSNYRSVCQQIVVKIYVSL
jgi:hypothetical protein